MLRGDLPEDEKLREYADVISGALKKNKLNHDVVCYRGVYMNPLEGVEVGDIIKPKQFYSTSVVKSRSFGAKYMLKIYAKRGSKAAYVELLSAYPKQRELLIDKDCLYRVLLIQENKIELEVI